MKGEQAAADSDLVKKCSDLFSGHYGLWGPKGKRPGDFIREGPVRIKSHLEKPGAKIYYAEQNGCLIGYAIASDISIPDNDPISWVTQLVVHRDFRHGGIATTILQAIFGMSNRYAWGIVSSNAIAVRALESATRRLCQTGLIASRLDTLIDASHNVVDYIPDRGFFRIGDGVSTVDTQFYTYPKIIEKNLKSVEAQRPWQLGRLKEGEEWFAFTFNDQEQVQLSPHGVRDWLKREESNVRTAYSRMDSSSSRQSWAQYTDKEVDQIIRLCGLKAGDSVLDVGCGNGRHSQALVNRGMNVTGIDYTDVLPAPNRSNPQFIRNDCRGFRDKKYYDAVLCLYDVVGSYSDNSDNLQILQAVSENLKKGGRALISVMNWTLTEKRAKHFVDLDKNGNDIFKILPSQTMEKTGDIFNPDHYAADRKTHVVYRKEQFLTGDDLPVELLVCDQRFTAEEIDDLCRKVGLNVLDISYVRAGNWETKLAPDNDHAKEILLLCERTREHLTFLPKSMEWEKENRGGVYDLNLWKGQKMMNTLTVTGGRRSSET